MKFHEIKAAVMKLGGRDWDRDRSSGAGCRESWWAVR